MTQAIANNIRQFPSSGHGLWKQINDLFSSSRRSPTVDGRATAGAEADDRVKLIAKIDHGFEIEETGQTASVPRFARAHLKTLVETGGWG